MRCKQSDYAACLVRWWLAVAVLFLREEMIRLFSDSLSPAIDQAISHTSATIVPRPMISTMRHIRQLESRLR